MRTTADAAAGVRPARTLTEVFTDATALLRQDLGEYGFQALVGGFCASFVALVLNAGGGFARPMAVPAAALVALLTFATACAAVRRVEENLQPDTTRSVISMLVRLPWIVLPMAPALALTAVAMLIGVVADRWITDLPANAIALILLAFAVRWAITHSMQVTSIFESGTSARQAAERGEAIFRSAPLIMTIAWLLALAPAALVSLAALAAGFQALATVLSAGAGAASMPFAAALLTLLYDSVMPAEAVSKIRERRAAPPEPAASAARLQRHIR